MFDASELECECSSRVLTRRTFRNGSHHWCRQCITCGMHTNSMKAEEANRLIAAGEPWEEFDETRADKYHAILRERSQRDRLDLKQQRLEEYQRYLQSPEWQSRRRKVLQRAKGICEGCLESRASQVHHTTYDNAGAELLYQLVALCDKCHDRVHHG